MIELTKAALLVGLALGGYFAGGVLNNAVSGESVGRMFAGSTTEQAIQLLVAAALVYTGAGVVL